MPDNMYTITAPDGQQALVPASVINGLSKEMGAQLTWRTVGDAVQFTGDVMSIFNMNERIADVRDARRDLRKSQKTALDKLKIALTEGSNSTARDEAINALQDAFEDQRDVDYEQTEFFEAQRRALYIQMAGAGINLGADMIGSGGGGMGMGNGGSALLGGAAGFSLAAAIFDDPEDRRGRRRRRR